MFHKCVQIRARVRTLRRSGIREKRCSRFFAKNSPKVSVDLDDRTTVRGVIRKVDASMADGALGPEALGTDGEEQSELRVPPFDPFKDLAAPRSFVRVLGSSN